MLKFYIFHYFDFYVILNILFLNTIVEQLCSVIILFKMLIGIINKEYKYFIIQFIYAGTMYVLEILDLNTRY